MEKKRRRHAAGILIFFLVFAVSCPVQAANPSVSVSAKVNYTQGNQFLKKLNALRKKNGLAPLKTDRTLQKAAELRAMELTVRYAHERPNDRMPYTITAKISAENIAKGYASAGGVYTAWKNSPTHYQNMVRPEMKAVGICCLEYRGTTYWVNVFGTDAAQTIKLSGRKSKTRKVSIAGQYLTASHIGLGSAKTMASKEKKTLRISIRCSEYDSPGTLPNSAFTFKSSNKKVLKVNAKGVVTSRKEGKAKITVRAKFNRKLKKTFQIVVKDDSRLNYIDYSDD